MASEATARRNAQLAALHRDHEELLHRAEGYAEAGDDAMARCIEQDAAVVEARIATLDGADGLAFGAPMDGWAA